MFLYFHGYTGRYDLKDSRVLCEGCGNCFDIEYPHNVIREHLWPGTPSCNTTYIFDQDMFLLYDLLQKNMPGISETGFLKSLEQFSAIKGRVGHYICDLLLFTCMQSFSIFLFRVSLRNIILSVYRFICEYTSKFILSVLFFFSFFRIELSILCLSANRLRSGAIVSLKSKR